MHAIKISFQPIKDEYVESVTDSVNYLLGAWRMNGQILGKQFLIAKIENGLDVYVNAPAADSLSEEFNSEYVSKHLSEISEKHVALKITVLGEEPEGAMMCECPKIKSYILFTTYLSLESSLRCFECFGVVPLYKIPKTSSGEYYDIICWQSDYQSCDSLQMNCTVGERFGTDQMSKYDSQLTKQGVKVCQTIKKVTGKKVFYYLYKATAKSYKSELLRKCPSCGGIWALKKSFHGKFDFMCRKCNLLSNIAWSVYA